MRIQFFSDVHLEFKKCIPIVKSTAPILCLLGDIGHPFSDIYVDFLGSLNSNPYFHKIFLITGNHEYYMNNQKRNSISQTNFRIKKIIKNNRFSKISFLNNETEIYQNHLFVGSTLWSHVSNEQYLINDFNMIKGMNVSTYNRLHSEGKSFIKKSIENSNRNTVVLTHHLPSYQIIHPKYKNYSNYYQCFASNRDELIRPPICTWLYGHTHTPKFDIINDVPVTCNPIGYYNENNDYKKNIVI